MSIPVRRIVTGHDADGKAVIIMDGPAPNQKTRSPGSPTSTLCRSGSPTGRAPSLTSTEHA